MKKNNFLNFSNIIADKIIAKGSKYIECLGIYAVKWRNNVGKTIDKIAIETAGYGKLLKNFGNIIIIKDNSSAGIVKNGINLGILL